MENLVKFNYESSVIRTISENGEIWFVGIDVCRILENSNTSNAIKKLDADEKKINFIQEESGRKRKTWTISESGLYSLILTSTKPMAKTFKRWISHEVLPAIRKTGKYTTNETYRSLEELKNINKNIIKLKEQLAIKKIEIQDLKHSLALQEHSLQETFNTDTRQLSISF